MWRKAYGLKTNCGTRRGVSKAGRKGAKCLVGVAV